MPIVPLGVRTKLTFSLQCSSKLKTGNDSPVFLYYYLQQVEGFGYVVLHCLLLSNKTLLKQTNLF